MKSDHKHHDRSMILAGDIGGTNARFACLSLSGDAHWVVENFSKVKCADYATFDEALTVYISSVEDKPIQAAFVAAGPVKNGHVNLTNTNWEISTDQSSRKHGFTHCGLYNDFAGMTRSVTALPETAFEAVHDGQPQDDAPILVAGPGTGFGVGYLLPCGPNRDNPQGQNKKWRVLSTEGGHVTYSPQNALEFELLQILQRDHGFVSLELVSSGKGLPSVHRAICEIHGQIYQPLSPDRIREKSAAGDAVCRDICQIRAAATMGAIADLALAGGARGGIVLAGGVSERMIDYYKSPAAMARYLERGARADYVKDIPIRLLKSPMAPLIGAALLMQDS